MSAAFKLYEMTGEVIDLCDALVEAGVDDDTASEALSAYLDGSSETIEQVCRYLAYLKRQSEALKAEEDDLRAKRKARENAETRIKDALKDLLDRVGKDKIEAGVFTVSLQPSPASVELSIPPEELPKTFQRVTIEADKAALKDVLAAGVPVEGAQLVVRKHVRIR